MPLPAPDPQIPSDAGTAATGLRASHLHDASSLQLAGDRLTALVGSPTFVALLFIAIPVWILANLAMIPAGLRPVDPPPFAMLQTVTAISALAFAGLILMTQRHEDRLLDHRAQLILELSIANDQKIAKIIELLEESRRDNPAISNRIDDQAQAMSTPSDATAVLEAIKEMGEGSA